MISVYEIIAELANHNINDKLEVAHFLAQAAHESQGFTKFEEGTRYRFGRAKIIWPSKSNLIQDQQKSALETDFVPQPWLFNMVYGKRMGNIAPDDGYKFRGAGIFQLTGRANYQAFLNSLDHNDYTIDNIRNYCLTEVGAIRSAIWFWQYNKIGFKARSDDLIAVTKAINGGMIGLEDRGQKLKEYKKLMGVA